MRKAILAVLLVAFAGCDAGANCGGCAPPRTSFVGVQDAGVNLTSAPFGSAPTTSASSASSTSEPWRPVAVPSVVVAPPAYPTASATTTTPHARPVPAANALDAAPPFEDAEVPVDASTVVTGDDETPDGAIEDAASTEMDSARP